MRMLLMFLCGKENQPLAIRVAAKQNKIFEQKLIDQIRQIVLIRLKNNYQNPENMQMSKTKNVS